MSEIPVRDEGTCENVGARGLGKFLCRILGDMLARPSGALDLSQNRVLCRIPLNITEMCEL